MNEIFCVDPAIKTPETESFNLMMSLSPLNVIYHLPAQQGMTALLRREQMTSIKGLIILGSACSVHDQLPWQEGLHQWIKTKLTTHLPILAICYGHQLIAHLFGASVENTAKPYK